MIMASLNVPEDLYRKLQEHARDIGHSPDEDAAQLLERALSSEAGEHALLEEIRRERDAMADQGVCLSDDALREGRNWGRK